jgi:hypothetical protein
MIKDITKMKKTNRCEMCRAKNLVRTEQMVIKTEKIG